MERDYGTRGYDPRLENQTVLRYRVHFAHGLISNFLNVKIISQPDHRIWSGGPGSTFHEEVVELDGSWYLLKNALKQDIREGVDWNSQAWVLPPSTLVEWLREHRIPPPSDLVALEHVEKIVVADRPQLRDDTNEMWTAIRDVVDSARFSKEASGIPVEIVSAVLRADEVARRSVKSSRRHRHDLRIVNERQRIADASIDSVAMTFWTDESTVADKKLAAVVRQRRPQSVIRPDGSIIIEGAILAERIVRAAGHILRWPGAKALDFVFAQVASPGFEIGRTVFLSAISGSDVTTIGRLLATHLGELPMGADVEKERRRLGRGMTAFFAELHRYLKNANTTDITVALGDEGDTAERAFDPGDPRSLDAVDPLIHARTHVENASREPAVGEPRSPAPAPDFERIRKSEDDVLEYLVAFEKDSRRLFTSLEFLLLWARSLADHDRVLVEEWPRHKCWLGDTTIVKHPTTGETVEVFRHPGAVQRAWRLPQESTESLRIEDGAAMTLRRLFLFLYGIDIPGSLLRPDNFPRETVESAYKANSGLLDHAYELRKFREARLREAVRRAEAINARTSTAPVPSAPEKLAGKSPRTNPAATVADNSGVALAFRRSVIREPSGVLRQLGEDARRELVNFDELNGRECDAANHAALAVCAHWGKRFADSAAALIGVKPIDSHFMIPRERLGRIVHFARTAIITLDRLHRDAAKSDSARQTIELLNARQRTFAALERAADVPLKPEMSSSKSAGPASRSESQSQLDITDDEWASRIVVAAQMFRVWPGKNALRDSGLDVGNVLNVVTELFDHAIEHAPEAKLVKPLRTLRQALGPCRCDRDPGQDCEFRIVVFFRRLVDHLLNRALDPLQVGHQQKCNADLQQPKDVVIGEQQIAVGNEKRDFNTIDGERPKLKERSSATADGDSGRADKAKRKRKVAEPRKKVRQNRRVEIRLDAATNAVWIKNECHTITPSQFRVLDLISKGGSRFQSSSSMKENKATSSAERPDRIIERMPKPIWDLIEHKEGRLGGFRFYPFVCVSHPSKP